MHRCMPAGFKKGEDKYLIFCSIYHQRGNLMIRAFANPGSGASLLSACGISHSITGILEDIQLSIKNYLKNTESVI